MNLKKLFFSLFFSGCLAISAADRISSVTFQQQGPFRYGEDVLRFNVNSVKGGVYSPHTVNEDIKRLHGVGAFSDVSVETIHNQDGTVSLVFKLKVQPVVDKIEFKGNEQIPSKTLMEKVTISIGEPLSNKALQNSIKAIKKLYAEKGLTEAVVAPMPMNYGKDGHVTVRIHIKENLKYTVAGIVFNGAKAFKKSELEKVMQNQSSMFYWVPLLELGRLDKEALEADIVRLRELYWTKGYLDFAVKETHLVPVEGKPDRIRIDFFIEEGKPYKVGKITIAGAKRFTEKELARSLRLKQGDVFNSALEQKSVQLLEDNYAPLGFADASCRITRIPNYQTHVVDLAVDVQEGLPYTVREVYIAGNKWTKDHVIRRELAIEPDDPVDKHRITGSKNRLMGMGYFKKVEAVSMNSAEAQKKDVLFRVEEKSFLNGKIGAGFSDTDSLAGMLELSHSNMDILDPRNYFTGGGQRARLLAMYGVERYALEANFTEPWLFGIPLRWEVSGYVRNAEYENWSERRIGVTTELTKRFYDDFTSVSIGYTFEHVWVHDMDDDEVSKKIRDEAGGSLVGRVQLVLDRDTRDNAFDPKSGYDINILGAISSRFLGGSNDYYRFELKGINYYSFFDNMFTLSLGGKIGAIGNIGGDSDEDPPIYERYFLGGGDSLRGFPYREVSPKDNGNNAYGGDFMYLLTAELSHPIYDFIRGAVFVDCGDVTHSRFGPFNSPNIGIGYGLRIKVPMLNAPVKIDLAYPVLNNQDGVSNSLRVHFNMGFSVF